MPVALISGLCLIEGWTPTEIPIRYIPARSFGIGSTIYFDSVEMFRNYNRPNRSRNSSHPIHRVYIRNNSNNFPTHDGCNSGTIPLIKVCGTIVKYP
jgi:hypothetical protein